MRLLLLGCSGFIGRELVPHLLNKGHQLTLISRQPFKKLAINGLSISDNLNHLKLDPSSAKSWEDSNLLQALKEADGVINLTGEPIAEKRWTPSHLKTIEDSRLNTTKAVVNAMTQINKPPSVLINASAIGYYGTSENNLFTEESLSGSDFLAELCTKWEKAAAQKPNSTRLLIIRIGIVLGPNGGALGKMLPIFKAGLGGPIGNGRQWMSWIFRTDLCEIISQALETKAWSGVINAVSPYPVSMADFANTLGKVLRRPSLLTVPGPILKLLLGDGAQIVLKGQNVQSKKLTALKFSFQYPQLLDALHCANNPQKIDNKTSTIANNQ